jgi:hypothetical protein
VFLLFLLFPFILSANFVDEMVYIAEHHLHGYRDDHLSYDESKKIIKNNVLHKTCGPISDFTIQFLAEKGIKSRFVLFLTLDEWNDCNNGHSLLEVYDQGHWQVWDIDLKNYFVKDGRLLNAVELCKACTNSSFEIVLFSHSEKLAYGDLFFNSIDYTSLFESIFLSTSGMDQFYKRCCQVVLIKKGDFFYFTCAKKDKKRIESYPGSSFIYMPKSTFLSTFYP